MNKNSFGRTMTSDLFKVGKLKSVWIALIIMFALILVSFATYWVMNEFVDKSDFGGEEMAKLDAQFLLCQMKNALLYGSSSTVHIELFVAIIACIFIGKDFSGGSVAILTARGQKRAHTYFSKWLTLVCLTVAYACVALVVSGIFYAFGNNGSAFTGADFGMLMRNFALQLLCGIASVSIFVMIAFLARNTGSAIAFSVGAYVILGVIIGLVNVILSVKSNKAVDDWSYFMPLRQMSAACTYGKMSTTQIIAATVMPVVYTVVSTLIGYFTFEKRDIR